MNLLAYKQDFDWSRVIFLVIFLIAWAGNAVRTWWNNNKGTIMEKFKKLDEEFKKRQAGERSFDGLPGAQLEEIRDAPRFVPPPLPVNPRISSEAPVHRGKRAAAADAVVPALVSPAASVNVRHNPLTDLIRQRDGLRRAIVLREVLGAPKALQMEGDHVI